MTKVIEALYKGKIKKVVVLEPHPDDGIFSIGGTLLQLSFFGVCIDSLCVFSNSTPKITKIRKKENDKIYSAIMNGNNYYYDMKDGYYRSNTNKELFMLYKLLKRKIVQFLSENKYDIIFVPAGIGNHIDHVLINKITLDLMMNMKYDFKICIYEDFPYCYQNRNSEHEMITSIKQKLDIYEEYIDIGRFLYKKVRCFMVYKSQVDYTKEELVDIIVRYGKDVGMQRKSVQDRVGVDGICERIWHVNKI